MKKFMDLSCSSLDNSILSLFQERCMDKRMYKVAEVTINVRRNCNLNPLIVNFMRKL